MTDYEAFKKRIDRIDFAYEMIDGGKLYYRRYMEYKKARDEATDLGGMYLDYFNMINRERKP